MGIGPRLLSSSAGSSKDLCPLTTMTCGSNKLLASSRVRVNNHNSEKFHFNGINVNLSNPTEAIRGGLLINSRTKQRRKKRKKKGKKRNTMGKYPSTSCGKKPKRLFSLRSQTLYRLEHGKPKWCMPLCKRQQDQTLRSSLHGSTNPLRKVLLWKICRVLQSISYHWMGKWRQQSNIFSTRPVTKARLCLAR